MKKIIIILTLLITLLLSCKGKQGKKQDEKDKDKLTKQQIKALRKVIVTPKGMDRYDYFKYLKFFGPKWADYKVKSDRFLKVFKKYFGVTPYRVVWHWDMDGDGYRDFLAVEVHPKVNRGVKRGILVDALGVIKLYIDNVKGIYAPDKNKGGVRMILDLERLGIKKGELACFSLGYQSPELVNYKYKCDDLKVSFARVDNYQSKEILGLNRKCSKKFYEVYESIKEERKRRYLPALSFECGEIRIIRIDKDLKSMAVDMDGKPIKYGYNDKLKIDYFPASKYLSFYIFTIGVYDYHKLQRETYMKRYRNLKAKGKALSLPKISPEKGKAIFKLFRYYNR